MRSPAHTKSYCYLAADFGVSHETVRLIIQARDARRWVPDARPRSRSAIKEKHDGPRMTASLQRFPCIVARRPFNFSPSRCGITSSRQTSPLVSCIPAAVAVPR